MYTLSKFPATSQRVMLSLQEIAHILILADQYSQIPEGKTYEINGINGGLIQKMTDVLKKSNVINLMETIESGSITTGSHSPIQTTGLLNKIKFPLDTELTISAPDEIKILAIEAVKSFFKSDPIPDKGNDDMARMMNSTLISTYQAQVLSLLATNEVISTPDGYTQYRRPIKPIDQSISLPITGDQL